LIHYTNFPLLSPEHLSFRKVHKYHRLFQEYHQTNSLYRFQSSQRSVIANILLERSTGAVNFCTNWNFTVAAIIDSTGTANNIIRHLIIEHSPFSARDNSKPIRNSLIKTFWTLLGAKLNLSRFFEDKDDLPSYCNTEIVTENT